MIADLDYTIRYRERGYGATSILKGSRFNEKRDLIINSHNWTLHVDRDNKKYYTCTNCSANARTTNLTLTYLGGEGSLKCLTEDDRKIYDIIV